MLRVYIVIGSVRQNRIGGQVAQWVASMISLGMPLETEVVDLRDWPLPLGDEPEVPATGSYVHEHTRKWSRKIAAADGYVFVTPQYNRGYPAALKNALDHLFNEWNGKPALIVSYGHHGGSKAAAQLRQVLEGLRMQSVAIMPAITFSADMLSTDGSLRNPKEDFGPFAAQVADALQELAALLTASTAKSGDQQEAL